MKLFYFLFFSLFILISCKGKSQAKETSKDNKYANVFKPLDGTWKGEFVIYEDTSRVQVSGIDLEHISIQNIRKSSLVEVGRIQVKQVYTSESPYYQKVTITDYYPKENKTEISTGVNKVEDGEMWCVVNKPNEKVVHFGITEGEKTIIWRRKEQNPQKIEFFKEKVSKNTYSILGYGYYQGDDIKLTPRLWFFGEYKRQD
ncbi:hypothetical protein [Wenyingzhuangia sp. IMCC45574]